MADFRETLQQVALLPSVQRALEDRAKRALGAAKLEAYRAGRVNLGDQLKVTAGVRPGSKAGGFRRSYARVEAALTAEQQAADNRRGESSRKQIMRRAARG